MNKIQEKLYGIHQYQRENILTVGWPNNDYKETAFR